MESRLRKRFCRPTHRSDSSSFRSSLASKKTERRGGCLHRTQRVNVNESSLGSGGASARGKAPAKGRDRRRTEDYFPKWIAISPATAHPTAKAIIILHASRSPNLKNSLLRDETSETILSTDFSIRSVVASRFAILTRVSIEIPSSRSSSRSILVSSLMSLRSSYPFPFRLILIPTSYAVYSFICAAVVYLRPSSSCIRSSLASRSLIAGEYRAARAHFIPCRSSTLRASACRIRSRAFIHKKARPYASGRACLL